MNRKQFMEQLERLLSDISEAERQEALEYYEGYFDDAGPENEGEVIRELGNPGKVAAIIKADLQENSEDYGEYTENGYQDTRVKENGEMPDHYTEVTVYGNGQGEAHRDTGNTENFEDRRKRRAQRGYHAEKKQNKAGIILALIVLVFAAPLIKGLFGGVLGILVTLALLPFLLTIFCRSGIDHPCDRCSCVHCCWDCHDGVSSAGRDPDDWYRMPDDGIWTFVTVTDGVVYR